MTLETDPSDDELEREIATLPFDLPRRKPVNLWLVVGVVALFVVATLGYGFATGWFRPATNTAFPAVSCSTAQNLTGAGSDLAAELVDAWAAGFVVKYSNVTGFAGCLHVQYTATGNAPGLTRLESTAVDFAATEAPPNATQAAALPGAVETFPVTVGGVAVVYNIPGIGPGLNLSGSVLESIYAGKITEWSDAAIESLNPSVSFPSGLAISVLSQANGSGSNIAFSQYLAEANASWQSLAGSGPSVAWPVGTSVADDAALAAAVTSTPGAIGYAALPYATSAGLSEASLENAAGRYQLPSNSTLEAAASAPPQSLPTTGGSWANVSLVGSEAVDAYPLTTFSYILLYADMGVVFGGHLSWSYAWWMGWFVHWATTMAQGYTVPASCAPLPPTIAAEDTQIIELLKYNGAPLLGDPDGDHD